MPIHTQVNSDIGNFIRKSENDWTSGVTRVSKHVDFSAHDDINRIYAYLESKHISGSTDSQGREKPFFNIVLAARNIWHRATDIDRKNIKLRAKKIKEEITAFLATAKLHEWMRRENFGKFLNDWGINSAGFNESVLKFVEQDGRLIPSVVPWSRIICDVVDFENNPKIEILELTPSQLKKNKSYDQDMVKELMSSLSTRENVDGQHKDNKAEYVKVYEIHGEMPEAYLTGDDSDTEFVQQMHVVSFTATKKGEHNDYTLYKGKESNDPYILTALLPEIDGSIALRGAVKVLFDAQWMQNHTVKNIKDYLDLSSKLIYQTSDDTFYGRNVYNAIQTGDILITKPNQPLTQVANSTNDIVALSNFGNMWKSLGNEIAGISEAMLGVAPKSGTPWRQTEAILKENHDLFELMTENKGLDIERMMREFVIPHLKKKLDTTDEVVAALDAHNLDKIDSMYIKNTAIKNTNNALKEKILSGVAVNQEEQAELTAQFSGQAREGLNGSQRFFKPSDIKDKTWKELFKDFEWEVEVDVTNENLDAEALTTLNTMLSILGQNPQALQDPNFKMVWNKILQLTGAASPMEIADTPIRPQAAQGPQIPPQATA